MKTDAEYLRSVAEKVRTRPGGKPHAERLVAIARKLEAQLQLSKVPAPHRRHETPVDRWRAERRKHATPEQLRELRGEKPR